MIPTEGTASDVGDLCLAGAGWNGGSGPVGVGGASRLKGYCCASEDSWD